MPEALKGRPSAVRRWVKLKVTVACSLRENEKVLPMGVFARLTGGLARGVVVAPWHREWLT